MKSLIALLFILSFPSISSAAVVCLFSESASATTQNRHCESGCDRAADTAPIETLVLNMPKKWADKEAFFKTPVVRCEGGNGCKFINVGKPRTFNSGKSIDVTYKAWSIPVKMVLEAQICVVE